MNADELWEAIKHEAYGDLNRYYTFLEVGHTPTNLEALQHFLNNGGEEYVISLLTRGEKPLFYKLLCDPK